MPDPQSIRPSYADFLTADQQRRFWSKVEKLSPTACWPWLGYCNPGGYGRFERAQAHRVAWELLRARIPDGLVIDHVCRNRSCVNPAHMEIVSNRENVLRGVGLSAINRRKTHCDKGHEFTPENTRYVKGVRDCRRCDREWWRAKQKTIPPHPSALRTHCKRGHEFTPENTYFRPKGDGRECKTCHRECERRTSKHRGQKGTK